MKKFTLILVSIFIICFMLFSTLSATAQVIIHIDGPAQGYEDRLVKGRNWGKDPLEYEIWMEDTQGNKIPQQAYYYFFQWGDGSIIPGSFHGPKYIPYTKDNPWQYDHTYKEVGSYTISVRVQNWLYHTPPPEAQISASTSLNVNILPTPFENLECYGGLNWIYAQPGDRLEGSFAVVNEGDAGSKLNWEITNMPVIFYDEDIQTSILPMAQTGLTPEQGNTQVSVVIEVPEGQKLNTNGFITVKNTAGDMVDFDKVPFSISNSRDKNSYRNFNILERLENIFPAFRLINRLFNL